MTIPQGVPGYRWCLALSAAGVLHHHHPTRPRNPKCRPQRFHLSETNAPVDHKSKVHCPAGIDKVQFSDLSWGFDKHMDMGQKEVLVPKNGMIYKSEPKSAAPAVAILQKCWQTWRQRLRKTQCRLFRHGFTTWYPSVSSDLLYSQGFADSGGNHPLHPPGVRGILLEW